MTNLSCNTDRCADCISHFVCTCMKVTASDLHEVILLHGINDLHELRAATGAGDGCMACRRRLQNFLDEHAVKSPYRGRVPAISLELAVCE